MNEEFIRNKINELRMKKNISEYQLSLDLGYSQGYIQSITSGRNLPSMNAFLDICAYFDITPSEFFDSTINNPSLIKSVMEYIKRLSDNDIPLLATVLKRFLKYTNIPIHRIDRQFCIKKAIMGVYTFDMVGFYI